MLKGTTRRPCIGGGGEGGGEGGGGVGGGGGNDDGGVVVYTIDGPHDTMILISSEIRF